MPKTTEFLYDDVHYTRAGNALIGNALADDIEAWGIIPQTLSSDKPDRGEAKPADETP
jgi:hypothetical protein